MIGFIDSGVGGLSILKPALKKFSNQSFVYIVDNAHAPFGQLNKNELIEITKINVETLIKLGCEIIVLACNTATAAAISFLRETYPNIVFIGTEPNIKGPMREGYNDILVLATSATIEYSSLINKYSLDCRFIFYKCLDLASIIENNLSNKKKLNILVTQELTQIKNSSLAPDAIVLGCTHYPLIRKQIKKVFKIKNIYSSTDGVIKYLDKKIKEKELKQTKKQLQLILTKFDYNLLNSIVNYLEN